MAALLARLLALALCCAHATAMRDDLDLEATETALEARAGMGARAGDAELDSAHVGKHKLKCACLSEKVGQDPEAKSKFGTLEECTEKCPRPCHGGLEYSFGTKQAQVLGFNQDVFPDYPVTAAQCSEEGECLCLNAAGWKEKVKEYKRELKRKQGTLKQSDLAQATAIDNGSQTCLKGCHGFCTTKLGVGYKGYCLQPWDWLQFLAQDQGCSASDRVVVGLRSCSLKQKFGILEDLYEDGSFAGYTTNLETLLSGPGVRQHYDEKEAPEAVLFEAETAPQYRKKYKVKVGFKGEKESNWKIHWTQVKGKTWTVEDEGGNQHFSIRMLVKKLTWEVHEVDGSGKQTLRYYIHGDKDANSPEGFKFLFYTDSEKTAQAGELECTDQRCGIDVEPGEDGGLIIMTSLLISKALVS